MQAALDKQSACIPLPRELPFETDSQGHHVIMSSDTLPKLHALTEAGLVSATPVKIKIMFGEERDGLRFDLTDAGRKLMEESLKNFNDHQGIFGRNRNILCYGTYKVSEIVRFTEPGDIGGMTASQVFYRRQVKDLPDWAKLPAVQAAWPHIADPSAADEVHQATLILTSDGWIESGMMNQ